MKNLSRLTALLLAIMVFTTMFAFAEGAVPQSELDMKSYSQMRSSMLDGSYQYFVDQLTKLDVDARYAKLVEWHESGLGTLFYNGFINYYKTAYPDGDLICTCAAPLAYGAEGHAEDCGWRAVEGTQLVDEITGVTVAGDLPTGLNLSVEPAALADVEAYLPELAGMENAHKVFDISLMQGRSTEEWQPETPVTVSMDVSDLGKNGDHMLVYHVHENEDGTVATELMGPFTVTDGQISFEMNRFSYVLVFKGTRTYEIDDVAVFYPVLDAPSGNGHYQFLGIYYDLNNDLHFLLATCDKTPNETESKFVSFYIDGKQYIVSTMGDNVEKVEIQTYSQLLFKDSELGTTLETVIITENKGIAQGFFDVNVGKQEVGRNFGFAISQDTNVPSGSQAWNINGIVTVDLDYEIIKTVAAGTDANADFADSVTVDRGDWVIFQINVDNKGTRDLQDMLVQDILPADVFDMNSVQMSIDGENGAIGNWQPFNQTLFENYKSPGKDSRLLYVKAQVRTDLAITEDTTYTNKATIDGMNMPTYTDTATVTVKKPVIGTLTVSKAVSVENPNKDMPDTDFSFTVTDATGESQTFTLKNGGSKTLENFPIGEYTVTETELSGYTTVIKADGKTVSGNTYKGKMESLGSAVVAFENTLGMVSSNLQIKKEVVKEYDKDILPDHTYTFTVVINDGFKETDGTIIPKSYTYTIDNGGTGGTVTNSADGNTITLKNGQTATILNLPEGTEYTVTEVLGADIADDYSMVKVNGEESTTYKAEGTMPVGGASVTFTNVYKKHLTDLTIAKTGCNNTLDAGQSFLFTVSNGSDVNLTIAINGNGSETISGLAVGDTITVTEIEGWSWRYTGATQTITLAPTGNSVTVENKRDEIYWLDGDCYEENTFSGVATE